MPRKVLRVSVVLVIGLVAGVIGWVIAALIGGNYAEQFVFNGVRGYEATGQIGFLLGALTGWFSSWRVLKKTDSWEVQTLENRSSNHALQLAGRGDGSATG